MSWAGRPSWLRPVAPPFLAFGLPLLELLPRLRLSGRRGLEEDDRALVVEVERGRACVEAVNKFAAVEVVELAGGSVFDPEALEVEVGEVELGPAGSAGLLELALSACFGGWFGAAGVGGPRVIIVR